MQRRSEPAVKYLMCHHNLCLISRFFKASFITLSPLVGGLPHIFPNLKVSFTHSSGLRLTSRKPTLLKKFCKFYRNFLAAVTPTCSVIFTVSVNIEVTSGRKFSVKFNSFCKTFVHIFTERFYKKLYEPFCDF